MKSPSQRPRELDEFIGILCAHGVRSYLEIGARYGQTLEEVGEALPVPSVLVAVELPNELWGRADSWPELEAVAERLRGRGHEVHLVRANSQDPRTAATVQGIRPTFDAVFIDADHRYIGCLTDWQLYGPLGHMVAFHDIAPAPENKRIEVPQLWHRLKDQAKSLEIVDAEHPGMGIGVLFPTIAPEGA